MRIRFLGLCLLAVLLGATYEFATPAVAAPAASAPAESRQFLPPIECVQLLRRARITELQGDGEAARGLFVEAMDRFSGSFLPAQELLDFDRRHRIPPERSKDARQRLAELLADAERPLPGGIGRYLANRPHWEPEEARIFLTALETRLAQTPDDPALLESAHDLAVKLDELETASTYAARLIENGRQEFAHRAFVLDLRLGHWEAALRYLDSKAEEVDEDLFLVNSRLEVLAKLGRYEELVDLLKSSNERFGLMVDDADIYTWAWDFYDRNLDEQAEALWRRALEVNPDNQAARKTLLYLFGTEEEQAALAADLAERWAAETDPDALFEEGTGLLAAGDPQGAFDLLSRAAPKLPDSEAAWFNLGIAAYRLERWEEVAWALSRATELNPERADAFFSLGLALAQLGRCPEALPALRRTLSLDETRRNAYYYIAGCLRESGDEAGAADALRLYKAGG